MQAFEAQQQANIDLVKQLYAAFARQDMAGILTMLAEEIDWLFYGPEDIPFAGHYCGHAQVAGFFARALETSDFLVFEPREFISGTHTVLVQGYEKVRAKATGRIWETEWAHVFTISNGKIVKLREYYDTAIMVAAFRNEEKG